MSNDFLLHLEAVGAIRGRGRLEGGIVVSLGSCWLADGSLQLFVPTPRVQGLGIIVPAEGASPPASG